MTNPAILEALAEAMAYTDRQSNDCAEDAQDFWAHTCDSKKTAWRAIAAAVLELVGPRELVWVWDVNMCAYSVVHSGKYYVQWDDEAGAWYASLELGDDENPIIIDPGDLPDISSAQSAAQAHADAAHWNNTPLGKLVGVE